MDFMVKDEKFRKFVKDNIDNFSLKESLYKSEEHEEINKIYKRDSLTGRFINHTPEEWTKLIQSTNRNGKQIEQVAIARHPLLTDKLANELIGLDKVYTSTLLELLKRDDLSSKTNYIIYCQTKLKGAKIMDDLFYYDKKTIAGTDTLKFILQDVIQDIKDFGIVVNDRHKYVFAHTDDNESIHKLISWAENHTKEIPEDILTLIASNTNITQGIRDRAFQLGCNWEKMTHYTRHMSKNIYPNIVIYPFNDNSDGLLLTDEHEKMKLTKYAMKSLNEFLKGQYMTVPQRLDLLNRLVCADPDYSTTLGELFSNFIDYEKDRLVLKDIAISLESAVEQSQSYLHHLLLNQNFQHTENFDKAIGMLFVEVFNHKELCDKAMVDNLIDAVKSAQIDFSIQDAIIDNIVGHQNMEIPTKPYDKRVWETKESQYTQIFLALMCSEHTSEWAYERLIKKENVQPNALLLAHLGKSCFTYAEKYDNVTASETKKIFFNCIKVNERNGNIDVNIDAKSDYNLVMDVLETAKESLPKKHIRKNKANLSKIMNMVKETEKGLPVKRWERALMDVAKEIDDLSEKNMLEFYINISDIQRKFHLIMKGLEEAIKQEEKPRFNLFSKKNDEIEFEI